MTYIHTCMYTHKDDTSSHHEHLYVNSKVTTNSSSGFLHHLPSALPPKSLQEFSERRFKFKEDLVPETIVASFQSSASIHSRFYFPPFLFKF